MRGIFASAASHVKARHVADPARTDCRLDFCTWHQVGRPFLADPKGRDAAPSASAAVLDGASALPRRWSGRNARPTNCRFLTPCFPAFLRRCQLPVSDASKNGFGILDSVVGSGAKPRRRKWAEKIAMRNRKRRKRRRQNPVVGKFGCAEKRKCKNMLFSKGNSANITSLDTTPMTGQSANGIKCDMTPMRFQRTQSKKEPDCRVSTPCFFRECRQADYRFLAPRFRIHSVFCFLNPAFFFCGVKNR